MNIKKWLNEMLESEVKRALPVLSFPSIQLMDISVIDLISNSDNQANGMKLIADKCNTGAALSMMDLSVEAEAFGATIKFSDDEVPTVIGKLLESEEDVNTLKVPEIGAGRTGIYIEAINKACKLITDRPVLAGVIGPFSLSGRLMDMTEIMCNCYTNPDMVKATLEKTTEFIIKYIQAFKSAGANGVVIAEPAAGLLSPDLNTEFSVPYVKTIVDSVQDDEFVVIYHNCGNVIPLIDQILEIGAGAYHFGNAIEMDELLANVPSNVLVMGNIDPSTEFRNGTPAGIREKTLELMEKCCPKHKNFIISSGCDIPPMASWENIMSFFEAVNEYYSKQKS